MRCIILCAGFATRLYPVTRNRPKALLTVGDQCILDVIVSRLAEADVQDVLVVCNHRFVDQFVQWRRRSDASVQIDILDNGICEADQRRGSVGDLHLALESRDICDDFLLVHGDNLFTFSLTPLLKAFHKKGNMLATYDVKDANRAKSGAQVTCDADGRIVDLVEKPRHPASTRTSIGIYAMDHGIRTQVDAYLSTDLSPDRTGDLMAWLHRQVPLYAYPIPGAAGLWYDIGTPESYHQAIRAVTG